MDTRYVQILFEAFELVKKQDRILTRFIYQKLVPTIDRFVALYEIDNRYLCHVDYPNLVGDLVLKYWEVIEQYERERYSDSFWNRVHYIFNSLRRETNKRLHEELDRFRPSNPKEKYESTVSTEQWERIDMDIRYCEPDINEFQFYMERWTDNEKEFVRLVFEKNNLVNISRLMDMSYSSAKRIKNRLKERVSEENRSKEGKRHPRIA